ncbi:hypothetical protein B0H63DRAFT_451121 [Podospora didyma]|uniref:Uncharacterized protein n=1 Tax=Podospora didyma TaxID=330526 RepID=A0AAE0NI05_9PEZI|nr:hypothetical protein B0H63DRAFT_451121 [Podospora didyma]
MLGHLVLGCDAAKAELNNAAVKAAFDQSYKAFNLNQMSKIYLQAGGQSEAFTGITHPITGELSLVLLPRNLGQRLGGWKPAYADGGLLVTEHEFPIRCFD